MPDRETPEAEAHADSAGSAWEETLLLAVIGLLFLAASIFSWWLTQRMNIPGAPGAPTG